MKVSKQIKSKTTQGSAQGVPRQRHTLPNGETVLAYGTAERGCTQWEQLNNVDMLGPYWERYDTHAERFVLDWDDTIKDTGKFWIQAHREVLQSFGFTAAETSNEAILSIFGNIEVAKTLGLHRFTKEGKAYTDDEVWELISNRAGELLAGNSIDPLLIKALKTAKSMGAHLSIWSSSPRELILAAIVANNLQGVFDIVVAVEDVEDDARKPHTQGFFRCLQAMDRARGYLGPDEDYSAAKPRVMNGVWMIGDSPNDILAGKQAGASTAWLEHPLHGHNAHESRQKTLVNVSKASSHTVMRLAMDEILPTVSIRTFNPKEAGYDPSTALNDIPLDISQTLTTVNANFAKFLIDPQLRSQLYRLEKVRAVVGAQHVNASLISQDLA